MQQAPRGFGVHLPTELLHVGHRDDHIEPMMIIGDNCKIKIKFDALDLIKMRNTKMMEFIIKNSCEEKMLNGTFVKQFTACSVSDYISEDQKTFKMKF